MAQPERIYTLRELTRLLRLTPKRLQQLQRLGVVREGRGGARVRELGGGRGGGGRLRGPRAGGGAGGGGSARARCQRPAGERGARGGEAHRTGRGGAAVRA